MCLDLSAGRRREIRAEHSDLGVAFRRKAATRGLGCSAEESCALYHIWFKTVILVKESNDWSVVRYPVFIL